MGKLASCQFEPSRQLGCFGFSHNCLGLFFAALVSIQSVAKAQNDDDPKLLNLAPRQCYFYSSWTAGIQPDASSTNSTQRLLAEQEVQAFFRQISDRVTQFAAYAGSNASEAQQTAIRTLAPSMMPLVTDAPGTMFIGPIQAGPGGIQVSAGLVVKPGENAKDLASAFMLLMESQGVEARQQTVNGNEFRVMPLPDSPVTSSLVLGSVDDYLIVALGEQTAKAIVAKLLDQTQPGTPQWLSDLQDHVDVPRRTSIGYINLKGLLELLQTLGGPNFEEAMPIVELLGLNELDALQSASGLDDKGMRSEVRLRFTGDPRGVVKLLAGKPLNLNALKKLPADSLFAAAFSLDLRQALDEALSIMQSASPEDAEQFRLGINGFRAGTGIDLLEFLDDLGSTWTLFNGAGDGLFSGLTLSVDLDDPEAVNQTLVDAAQLLNRMAEQNHGEPRVIQNRYGGTTIFTASIPGVPMPVQPSWAVIDGELAISIFPQVLKPLITPSPLDKKLDLVSLGVKEGISGFSYTDVKRQYEALYTYASFFYGMIPMAAAEAGAGPEGEMVAQMMAGIDLPSCRCTHRHLEPSVSLMRTTEDGILFTTTQTMPSVNVAVAAPVGVALLLPAVQSARAAARRMQSQNNLKQLALSMLNYESAFRRFPAVYSTDAQGKPLLSWRVHILPFVEEQRLYEQFHLDEPWDSKHNLSLLDQMPEVFRSPSSTSPPGTTVYRGFGGSNGLLSKPQKVGEKWPLGRRIAEITDGTANTIMFVEASDELAVEWTKPDELEPGPDLYPLFFGLHTGGTNAVRVDGSVWFLSETLDPDLLRRMLNIHDGEVIDWPARD